MVKNNESSPVQLKVQVWIYFHDPIRKTDQFLTLLTTKERGGFWQPVTGGVESGESLSLAALREAKEETGLCFESKPEPLAKGFEFQSRWGNWVKESGFMLRAQLPVGTQEPRVILDPKEHVQYAWRGFEEALGVIKHASNQELLKEAVQELNYKNSKKNK